MDCYQWSWVDCDACKSIPGKCHFYAADPEEADHNWCISGYFPCHKCIECPVGHVVDPADGTQCIACSTDEKEDPKGSCTECTDGQIVEMLNLYDTRITNLSKKIEEGKDAEEDDSLKNDIKEMLPYWETSLKMNESHRNEIVSKMTENQNKIRGFRRYVRPQVRSNLRHIRFDLVESRYGFRVI